MTKAICTWLGGFADLGEPRVDALGAEDGWALFPDGQKVIALRRDILGTERRRIRAQWSVKLRRSKDDTAVPHLLEQLAAWVRSGAPQFGQEQVVKLENARLTAQNGESWARYDATLVVEFTE